MPIGGSGTMADLTVTGYGDSYDGGQISCGKLDTYGRSIARMYWFDFTDGDTYYGWYDPDDGTEYNDVTLEPGEALWFYSPSAEYKVQSAGQVITESLPVGLSVGNQLVNNPTPVTLTMGDVWISGYGDSYDGGQISCGKLDNYGRSIARMYWFDFTDGDTYYGWYDPDDGTEYNGVSLLPGESLWLYSPSADYTINFPSPLN